MLLAVIAVLVYAMFPKLLGLLLLAATMLEASSLSSSSGNLQGVFDFDLYESVLDSELCERHLQQMESFEFYDASFRIPQGMLTGNSANYGNYFQCLGIRQELDDGDVIEGKHCMISSPLSTIIPWSRLSSKAVEKFQKYNNIKRDVSEMAGISISSTFSLGLCIPKSCTVDEALDQVMNTSLVTVNYQEQHCRLPGDKPFVAADYVAMVIFSAIGLISTVSTAYELRHKHLKRDPKELNTLYSCCSVFSNTRQLFTFSSSRSGTLDCLDGIRALSIIWIIVGHSAIAFAVAGVSNSYEVFEWYNTIRALWITASNIAVDTFFMLSGLLLVYTSVSKYNQMSFLKNIHMFYLFRFLRMFPILATGVLLQASIFHHIDDGANWHVEGQRVQNCRKSWWAALLYIQNYYNPREECLSHTWYLSVDMQLYILSPLVLFWVLGGRRSACVGLVAAMLASLLASTIFIYINNFAGNELDFVGSGYFHRYYLNTLTRAPPFVVGMVIGFILHVFRGHKIKMPAWSALVCWGCALLLFGWVVYAYHPINQFDKYNQQLNNFVNSFNRVLWTMALGWVVFACLYGYGGPVNWFLSLTVWKFIGRISYAMYIFHYPMQFISVSAVIAPGYFSTKNLFLGFIIDLTTSILISVIVCVFIDTPFATLQKLLLGGAQRKSPPKQKCEERECSEQKSYL